MGDVVKYPEPDWINLTDTDYEQSKQLACAMFKLMLGVKPDVVVKALSLTVASFHAVVGEIDRRDRRLELFGEMVAQDVEIAMQNMKGACRG
jgi:hypothetical protein